MGHRCLQRSNSLYETIKLLGAAYLVFLGVQSFTNARTLRDAGLDEGAESDSAITMPTGKAFWSGFISDVFNPKTGLFYVAIVPQVIPHGVSVFWGTLAFSLVDACVTTSWFALVATFADRFAAWLHRPRVLRSTQRSTGIVLVALGLRTAAERS